MFEHAVEYNQQFAHGRDQRHLFRLASCQQPLVEVPDSRVVAAGYQMLLSLAKWERDTIRDRIKAGVDRAAAEGRTGGRPPVLSSEKIEAIKCFLGNGRSVSSAARAFGVSRPTVRAVRDRVYVGRQTL